MHTLCGISVRFQTLFPSRRQIAHALLTRPPLSLYNASRRINHINSVRLECVKHAASVHPEPGSNSLNLVYYRLPALIPYLKLLILSCSSLLFEYQSFLTRFFVSLLRCSIFKDRFRSALSRRLIIITQMEQLVNPLFKIFSSFFNFFKLYLFSCFYPHFCLVFPCFSRRCFFNSFCSRKKGAVTRASII